MTKQSNFIEQKAWVTLTEAAQYLGHLFDAEVTDAEVLQLALIGRLRLSVRFVSPTTATHAHPNLFFSEEDRKAWEERDDTPQVLPGDVYDLPMTGLERQRVEYEY